MYQPTLLVLTTESILMDQWDSCIYGGIVERIPSAVCAEGARMKTANVHAGRTA